MNCTLKESVSEMLQTVNQVFQTFGASVVVPIMIFIVALCLRVKPKTAMMSAFYAGVGLTGFTWIIQAFTPVVTKVIKQMVNNTGIKLPVVDIGWQAGSLASFGSPVGLTFFVFGLIVELLLFALGVTKIFMASNLWNNFGFMMRERFATTSPITSPFRWASLSSCSSTPCCWPKSRPTAGPITTV